MNRALSFAEWEPIYEAVLADLGFDRAADERARDVAYGIVDTSDDADADRNVDSDTDFINDADAPLASEVVADLETTLGGASVCVVGAAPSLARELAAFDPASVDAIVAASTAVDVLSEAGIDVDCMVTDLDKNVSTAAELSRRGVPVAAHAHGDNIPALRAWLPRFNHAATLVTTQAEPRGPIRNVGGFTDGDRAAFLADACGANELRFLGWAFDDPAVDALKARKLRWAEHLLYWLERRRGERFAVLDGRREHLAPDPTTLSTR